MKKLFGVLCLATLSFFSSAQNNYAIIPKPTQLTETTGVFTVNTQTKILIPKNTDGIRSLAEMLAERFLITSGMTLEIEEFELTGFAPTQNKNIIFAPLSKKNGEKILGDEDYTLTVESGGVVLSAATSKGDFYALQTLLQLLPTQIYSSSATQNIKWSVPNCTIFDHPQFVYRGLMLDVSRHFFSCFFHQKIH